MLSARNHHVFLSGTHQQKIKQIPHCSAFKAPPPAAKAAPPPKGDKPLKSKAFAFQWFRPL
jgi:hypothetical protein